MITEHGLILLLTNEEDNWSLRPLESLHTVVTTSDFQQAVKMLNSIRCDLLVLDAAAFGTETLVAVTELKHYYPYCPVAVLPHETNDDYEQQLFDAGADLVLPPSISADELQRQVRIVLDQNAQRRALLARSRKIYLVSSLPLLLKELTDTRQVLIQATKAIINLLDVEAVSVVIKDDMSYRALSASKPFLNTEQFIEATLSGAKDDPVWWSIRHRMTQIYEDAHLNPLFRLPRGVDDHSAVVIVPFINPIGEYEAIVFFLAPKSRIVSEDVAIYEQVIAQLESVLLRVHQNQLHLRQLSVNKLLVEAWTTFADVDSMDEAVRMLCAVIGDMSAVQSCLIVWRDASGTPDTLVDSLDGELATAFNEVAVRRAWDELQTSLRGKSGITSVDQQQFDEARAEPLTELFGTNNLILTPIMVSDERLGIAIVAIKRDHRFDDLDLYVFEALARIASNALQRISLRNIVLKDHLELMSIICSISEGVFYVDQNQRVTFYNPQLTELTSISSTEWVNQNVDALLREIAMASQNPMQIHNQLQTAKQRLIGDDRERDYPIVIVPLADQSGELRIEFASIDNDLDKPSWMGIVHQNEQAHGPLQLERLLERLRVSHTQLRGAINTLAEQHGHFSYNERDALLQQIKTDATSAGKRWNQFYDFYTLYFGGLTLHREPASLNDLLERVLDTEGLAGNRSITVNLSARKPLVNVDEFHFGRALAALLAHLIDQLPDGEQLRVDAENHLREVTIDISSGTANPFQQIEELLARPGYLAAGNIDNLDLVIALELIRRNGVHISMNQTNNETILLRMVVPILSALTQQVEQSSLPAVDDTPVAGTPVATLDVTNSTPSRQPNSIMIIEGNSAVMKQLDSQLEGEGFNILHYKSGESALQDVTATHFDLIIMDVRYNDEDGFEICQRVRKRTETPILLIADNANPQEKVHGLQVGADDFVTGPVTREELLARVRVIVNRRYIAARSSEPMLFGDLYVDFARRAVFLQNVPIELTRIEYDILYTLIVNRGQTVTHKQLLTQVWGPEYVDESQYLWVNISRLRKKLEPTQDSPRYIRTQSGVGYYFAVP